MQMLFEFFHRTVQFQTKVASRLTCFCCNILLKQEFEDSLDKVGSDVEELRQQCVHLFGSGGADAGSSLKKRMDGLVALYVLLHMSRTLKVDFFVFVWLNAFIGCECNLRLACRVKR